jgi:uncharacterized protein (TIGR03437 family)
MLKVFSHHHLACLRKLVFAGPPGRLPFCLFFSAGIWAQPYTISTFAGTGTAGFSGDAGPAGVAQLSRPFGLAIDRTGSVYITDEGNQRLRVVSGGNIATVAGTGTAGYAGDGGAATGAQIYGPSYLAIDAAGDIIFSDSGNNVIRMIASDGTISTIAGVACTQQVTSNCGAGHSGDGASATAALLSNPLGIAIDSSGTVYFADADNNVIRQISGDGTISTVVSSLRLKHPDGVAIDSNSNLYIADTDNNRIVKLSPSGAAVIFAGKGTSGFSGDNGPAANAELSSPTAVALDGAGSVYITDTTNSRIRKVTNGIIMTIAGNGQPAYSGDGGLAVNAGVEFPRGIAVDPAGNVFVADPANNVIRAIVPPAPAISNNGIVNSASFSPHLSPGALATVFGTNFGAITAMGGVPLPNAMGPVSVSVSGRNAPLLYVSPTQVNFQVPWETATGTANVTVTVNNATSSPVSVPVLSAGPGIFTQSSGAAIVQNSDYSLNGPSNPAVPGNFIIAYLTGSGPLSASVPDGVPAPSEPLVRLTAPVNAIIGSQPAEVIFAGLTPGLIGVVQINITVPQLATGNYPLAITIGSEVSNSANISVKQ